APKPVLEPMRVPQRLHHVRHVAAVCRGDVGADRVGCRGPAPAATRRTIPYSFIVSILGWFRFAAVIVIALVIVGFVRWWLALIATIVVTRFVTGVSFWDRGTRGRVVAGRTGIGSTGRAPSAAAHVGHGAKGSTFSGIGEFGELDDRLVLEDRVVIDAERSCRPRSTSRAPQFRIAVHAHPADRYPHPDRRGELRGVADEPDVGGFVGRTGFAADGLAIVDRGVGSGTGF